MYRALTLCGSITAVITAALLAVATVSAKEADLIQIAPAGASALRIVTDKKDDPLTQAARRAADDPYPNAGSLQILEVAHQRDEQEWEAAFAYDMGSTFRQAADAVSVPYEYAPNINAVPDGWGITQLLANAVLRAKLPCGSIHSVDSLRSAHGWPLVCDQKSHAYAIALVKSDWKLMRYVAPAAQRRTRQ
jgi:hypothetical protein